MHPDNTTIRRMRGPQPRSLEDLFWPKVAVAGPDECWHWQGATIDSGYGVASRKPGDGSRLAHRIAWELTNGPIPDGMFVLHNCPGGDNPACVNPDHLFLGTQADNILDMVRKGRSGMAKLTAEDVRQMRRDHANGKRYAAIGRDYGVTGCTARKAILGIGWAHVSDHEGSSEPDVSQDLT